jgi:hypothetical protein
VEPLEDLIFVNLTFYLQNLKLSVFFFFFFKQYFLVSPYFLFLLVVHAKFHKIQIK